MIVITRTPVQAWDQTSNLLIFSPDNLWRHRDEAKQEQQNVSAMLGSAAGAGL